MCKCQNATKTFKPDCTYGCESFRDGVGAENKWKVFMGTREAKESVRVSLKGSKLLQTTYVYEENC